MSRILHRQSGSPASTASLPSQEHDGLGSRYNYFHMTDKSGPSKGTSSSLSRTETLQSLAQSLPDAVRNHAIAMIGEFVGTLLFLFFALSGTQTANNINTSSGLTVAEAGSNPQQLLYISLCFGFSLAVNAWTFFRISGGLFNPAVTLGLCLIGALDWIRGSLLFVTQIVAGMAAAGLVSCMFPGKLNVSTTLSADTSVAQGLFIEMFLTGQLVFTIFMLAAEKHKGTFMAPIGIGLSLFIAELTGVHYTGGSLNPARSFGPSIATLNVTGGGFPSYHWIYWLGPLLGALMAAGLFYLFKFLDYETANPGQDAEAKQKADAEAREYEAKANEEKEAEARETELKEKIGWRRDSAASLWTGTEEVGDVVDMSVAPGRICEMCKMRCIENSMAQRPAAAPAADRPLSTTSSTASISPPRALSPLTAWSNKVPNIPEPAAAAAAAAAGLPRRLSQQSLAANIPPTIPEVPQENAHSIFTHPTYNIPTTEPSFPYYQEYQAQQQRRMSRESSVCSKAREGSMDFAAFSQQFVEQKPQSQPHQHQPPNPDIFITKSPSSKPSQVIPSPPVDDAEAEERSTMRSWSWGGNSGGRHSLWTQHDKQRDIGRTGYAKAFDSGV